MFNFSGLTSSRFNKPEWGSFHRDLIQFGIFPKRKKKIKKKKYAFSNFTNECSFHKSNSGSIRQAVDKVVLFHVYNCRKYSQNKT